MPNNLYYFAIKLLCFPIAAFVVGILLYQLRFQAIWCLALAEGAVVIWYLVSAPTNYFYISIVTFHIIFLPVLLVPSFAGYYLNKHVLNHPAGTTGD